MNHNMGLLCSDPNLRLGFDYSGYMVGAHLPSHLAITRGMNMNSTGVDHGHAHHMLNHQMFRRSCSSGRVVGGVKRSVARAPRMRWTSTLHAHFVHAVQLLGGHESESSYILQIMNLDCVSFMFPSLSKTFSCYSTDIVG